MRRKFVIGEYYEEKGKEQMSDKDLKKMLKELCNKVAMTTKQKEFYQELVNRLEEKQQ